MRVVTWNLWWRFGDNWRARQDAIIATLEALAPDIACCQEVWAERDGDNQADVLAERLGMHVAHHPRFGRRGLSFANAILSRTPILRSSTHSLAVGDRSGHRSAVVARIAYPDPRVGEVPVICTHLEHRSR